MRIALLDPPSYSPAYDHHLAAALAARGHDVALYTSPFAFGAAPEPVGYERRELFLPLSGKLLRGRPRSRLRFLLKGVEYFPSVRRLTRAVSRFQPDVVHVQWLPVPRYDLRWVKRLRRGRPVLFTAHNVLPHEGEADVERRHALYDAFDRLVVHTRKGAEQVEGFGIPRERIVRIPHGTFDAPPAAAITPPSGRTLLFYGLIRRYKGLDVLLRALPQIRDAKLVVAGDPLDPVRPLRALARELSIEDRVEWRLGYLPTEEVASLMREATIAVFPYRSGESASGTLATALGHGRPVVVTEVLGETVREYGAGLVVPAEDPEALADACNRLLTDKAALTQAFHGTEWAREALSWSAIAQTHERVYSELLGRVAADDGD
ncbi:MAG TPA: glycosyltransferase [Gaiellaceae bacterium]|nr:glycosyltransferase [Gaiellaceae bacterium]